MEVQKVWVDKPAKHMATVETLAAPKNSNQCSETKTPFKSQIFKTEDGTRKDFFDTANIKPNPTAAITQRKKTIVSAFALVALPKMAVNAYKITIK
jgi:hypothetical protein